MANNAKKTLEIYWQHTKGYRVLLGLVFVSVIIGNLTGVIIPIYLKKFFDILSSGGNKDVLFKSLVNSLTVIIILEFIGWTAWRVATYLNTKFQTSVLYKLGITCFEYLHKHSFSYFNNNFVGTLVKRLNWFTRAFEGLLDRFIWNLFPLIIKLSLITWILASRNTTLAIAVISWLAVFLTINWFFTKYKMKFDIERSEAESKSTGILADTITNHANLKLFVGYDNEVDNFKKATDKVRKLRVFTWNLDSVFDGIQGFLVIMLEVGMFYVASDLWKQNKISVGDFVLIQSYMLMIFNEIWNFGKMIRHIFTNLSDAEEMTVLLSTPHEITDRPNADNLVVTRGKISFENVDFNYNATRKILANFNTTINPNEKVAFVGHSGAGKTTIIKLLLRMHDVSGGKITIDGQRIDEVKQESLWKNISLVPQDPILFHRSLKDNIKYGRQDATDEEMIEAAKLAHCHEFIMDFPDTYDTFVGERGVKLSGGERQRIAIARAILRNSPILILDEATSSLDSESESLIQDALNNLMKNKTVIVIAHRLSTIMKMDRILVLDHGSVFEQGNHFELLSKKGIYEQLWKRQAGGFIAEKPAANPTEELLAQQINKLTVKIEEKQSDIIDDLKKDNEVESVSDPKASPAAA